KRGGQPAQGDADRGRVGHRGRAGRDVHYGVVRDLGGDPRRGVAGVTVGSAVGLAGCLPNKTQRKVKISRGLPPAVIGYCDITGDSFTRYRDARLKGAVLKATAADDREAVAVAAAVGRGRNLEFRGRGL